MADLMPCDRGGTAARARGTHCAIDRRGATRLTPSAHLMRAFPSTPSSPALSCASSSFSSSPLSTSSSSSSSSFSPSSSDRCRYKTGRCGNARVVKPNGSRLLLCEFHRDQQNRTKKRSDMKYRHDRAKKRQIEKGHSPRTVSASTVDYNHSSAPIPNSPRLSFSLRHAAAQLAATMPVPPRPSSGRLLANAAANTSLSHALARPPRISLGSELLSPIVSTPTVLSTTPGAVHTKRESTSRSTALTKATLFKLSSGLRAAYTGSRISPGKARFHSSSRDAFASSRRDIVAMASPAAGKAPALLSPLSHRVFPFCLSPLRHGSSSSSSPRWQPEDLRLLEYFIL